MDTLQPVWIRPNLQNEIGEIERAMEVFIPLEPTGENIKKVTRLLQKSPFSDLTEEQWRILENTNSYNDVLPGQIGDARRIREELNKNIPPAGRRDFEKLLNAFIVGAKMECPTILEGLAGKLHLVSGNTRLMICRGLQIQPKVVIGKILA